MINTNTLISIIVPIYNVKPFLRRCIDSILNQTYQNFELILIDDGSTDGSGDICDLYSKNDNKVKVIHKQNEGVSIARNVGIDNVNGYWTCFVDSDDWLEPTYLHNFIEKISDSTDLIVQGFFSNYENSNRVDQTSFKPFILNNNYKVVMFFENTRGVHNGYIWHRIFRTNIIKNNMIRFQPGVSFAEDGWFFFEYLKYVKKTVFSDKIGYHHFRRNNSLTIAGRGIAMENLIPVYEGYLNTLQSFEIENAKDKNIFNLFIRKYGCRLMQNWLIQKIVSGDKQDSEHKLNTLCNIAKQYNLLKASNIDFSMRFMINSLNIKCNTLRFFLVKATYLYRLYRNKIINKLL